MDKLENTVKKMVELQLSKLDLPKNFKGVAVDIYPTDYGKMVQITLLMKTYFSGEDSDFFDEPMREIKTTIIHFFNDTFKGGVSSSISTIDHYNDVTKDIYHRRKQIKESMNTNKFIITESRLKSFLSDKLGIDLTGKVSLVTNKWELPMEFDRIFTPSTFNTYLNRFGPMYSLEVGSTTYLYQNQGDRSIIADSKDRTYGESELMDKLGIPPLGIKFQEILDLYV